MTRAPFKRAATLGRAFTLVETLVAITIVTLAILAPFDAIERVVNASRLAKDNLIASALAQEGLEYVRFIRTSNYLAARPTLFEGIDGVHASTRFGNNACKNGSTCDLDATQSTATAVGECSGGVKTCPPLYVNTSTGVYTFNTTNATPTIFKRGFTYTEQPSGVAGADYETVTVTVVWSDHGNQSLTLTENLYDWF